MLHIQFTKLQRITYKGSEGFVLYTASKNFFLTLQVHWAWVAPLKMRSCLDVHSSVRIALGRLGIERKNND